MYSFRTNTSLILKHPTIREKPFVGVCCCSVTKSGPTVCHPMDCGMPGFPGLHSQSLLKLISIGLMVNHHILRHPFLLLLLIFPRIRVFSNELALPIRWPEYWSFSFSIRPSHEYSGLISCRTDWFDLLAIQGMLKSFLQCHSLKALVHWCSAFFMVQLSYLYMTTGKITPLNRWTFIGEVMSLFFNALSRFIISFLPRSKCLLIHGWSDHLQWFWNTRK